LSGASQEAGEVETLCSQRLDDQESQSMDGESTPFPSNLIEFKIDNYFF
jgi:hypothetical protein